MSTECDDCGADGEELQCICKPKEPNDKAVRNRVVPRAAKAGRRAKGTAGEPDVLEPGSDAAKPVLRPTSAPQSPSKPGGLRITTPLTTKFSSEVLAGAARMKVKCCRCMHVHYHDERTNEWGLAVGFKWMAGRQTWCPKGCGYHVTIPVDD